MQRLQSLQTFFQGVQLGEGAVLDFANFNANRGKDPSLIVEWTEFDEADFRRNKFKAEMAEFNDRFEFVPPMGGGLRVITAAEYTAIARTAAASKELIKNLANVGATASTGEAAHHIVAHSFGYAGYGRYVLSRFGIGINSAENGVYLAQSVHQGLHTARYFQAVNRLLAQARTRDEVIQVLQYIKSELQNGTFPH
ncbi:MAG: AHH domain-containing protein [Pyrinomonadaceae bacterium]